MNIILGNLLETFEIFTKKSAAETKTPYFIAAERSVVSWMHNHPWTVSSLHMQQYSIAVWFHPQTTDTQ